ncbi:MAG TPA: DMT family transporter [Clostridiales bacterium]|nr:DMT family transporter [Clostridiales bacterium]
MNHRVKTNLFAFATISIWASGFPLSKIALLHFNPGVLGFLRCVIAAVILLIVGSIKHMRLPQKKTDLLWFLLAGASGFGLYLLLFNMGIKTLTSATSSLVVSLTPVLTALAAAKLYQERIKPIGWCMIGLAFAGVVILLLWDGLFSVNGGLLWTLGAMVVFSGYNLISRRLSVKGYTPLEIAFYGVSCGALILSFYLGRGITELSNATLPQLLSLLYLGVFPSGLAYFFWGAALGLAERTSEVTNYMFVTPLLSALLGFLLLGEIPTAGTVIGGGVIIGSIVVFNLKGK